eukprot:CAMPEP_0117444330 /NCGR_PEP_ID=MMETSP0759-20121206/5183_1 /TAXON_ID=63605 /ORGANISM="Percolomonas cosmopolitus, Strain WS" /LENGTH=743 /DNA_ID=CAMNT_0005236389 /DNA_START=1176 /DNA_END=3407 /DNA_ORIENTATION=-
MHSMRWLHQTTRETNSSHELSGATNASSAFFTHGSTSPPSATSQHLVSGLWIVIITSLTSLSHSLFQKVASFLSNSVYTCVTITNQDQPYEWLMSFLQQDEYFGGKADDNTAKNVRLNFNTDDLERIRHCATNPAPSSLGAPPSTNHVASDATNPSQVAQTPLDNLLLKELGDGAHWIKYNKKHWMHIHVSSADKLTTRGWDNEPFQMHTITITVYGNSAHTESILTSFINDAKKYHTEKRFESSAKIYLVSRWGSWMRSGKNKAKRSLDSVILDRDLAHSLLNDAKTFLAQKQWYLDHGIPYRRGYCIHGPPGSGKSSFVCALASELSLGICVLTLSSNNLDDQSLNELLHNTPPKCIILLEDIDAVFVAREATEIMESNRVTFSGLLNALDGVAAQEDKLFFMTTNHIDKLDPALLRPGRCDVKVRFDYASKQQVRDMWLRFNPESNGPLLSRFVDSIPELTVSCSSLQEHFLKYEIPEDAVENFHDLLRDPKRERQDIDSDVAWKDIASGRNIRNWLLRLGIPQYTATFYAQGFYNLEDIREFDEGILTDIHDAIPDGHLKRIERMLEGEQHVKSNFQLAPRWRVIELFKEYFGEEPPAEFVNSVAGQVSSFQLMEHFEVYTDHGASEAQLHIDELVEPKIDWKMTEAAKRSVYSSQPVLEFLQSIPFLTSEDVREIHENMTKEEIHSTDDLVELNASDVEKHVKQKGKALEIQFALDKLKKKREALKTEVEMRTISDVE